MQSTKVDTLGYLHHHERLGFNNIYQIQYLGKVTIQQEIMDSSAERVPQNQQPRQNPHPRPHNNNTTGRPWRGRGGLSNPNASARDGRDPRNLHRGRGRGSRDHISNGRKRDQVPSNPEPPAPNLQPPPGIVGGGTFGVHPTKDAESVKDEVAGTQEDCEVDGIADVCFICASSVVHNAIAPCNHRTCHICALRLRALYKTRACAHCRVSTAFATLYTFEKLTRTLGGGSSCNLHRRPSETL